MHIQTLMLGSKGPVVAAWKLFLRGQDCFHGEVTDNFDEDTLVASRLFQQLHSLRVDGTVGNQTWGKAMCLGFEAVSSPATGIESPNWPPPPDWSAVNVEAAFGKLPFAPAPTAANPEGIRILGTWARDNITQVTIPQLVNVVGAPPRGVVSFHVKAAPQLIALFKAWEDAGLIDRVKSWAGSWAPRFVRGSRTTLSNHAYGTAFDINAGWNGLGTRPALVGQPGSVRELVPLATEHGFYWGGFWNTRFDGMHFQVGRIL